MKKILLIALLCVFSVMVAYSMVVYSEDKAKDDVEAKVKELIKQLGDNDWETRELATNKLIEIGKEIYPLLDEILKSTTDPEVKNRLVFIKKQIDKNKRTEKLKKLSPELLKKVPDLIERAASDDAEVKLKLLTQLTGITNYKMGNSTVVGGYDYNLVLPDRKDLILILEVVSGAPASLPEKEKTEEYYKPSDKLGITTLSIPLKLTISQIARLYKIKEVSNTIADWLSDPDEHIRSIAVMSLGAIGEKKVIPQVLKSLDDNSATVREWAIATLGKLEADEATNKIIKMMEEMIEEISDGHKNCTPLGSWSATTLGRIGNKKAIPLLLKLSENSNEYYSSAAICALAEMGEESIIPKLIEMINNNAKQIDFTSQLRVTNGLWSINKIRNPKMYNSLKDITITNLCGNSDKEIFNKLSEFTKINFVLDNNAPNQTSGMNLGGPGWSIDSAEQEKLKWGWVTDLPTILNMFGGGLGFVLEDDKVVIMGRGKALKFWNDWAAKREK